MKNRLAIMVGILSVIILIAVIVMAYMMLRHPDKMETINKIAERAPQSHQLVVLDFDDNGLLDEAELLQGHDAVITVKNPKEGADEQFDSVSAFQELDVNKDGRIDDKDPHYQYMQLMFFTKEGKGRRYMSFTQAGVQSIKIDQKRLNEMGKATLSLHPDDNIIGKATFKNGQQHTIRLIAVTVP